MDGPSHFQQAGMGAKHARVAVWVSASFGPQSLLRCRNCELYFFWAPLLCLSCPVAPLVPLFLGRVPFKLNQRPAFGFGRDWAPLTSIRGGVLSNGAKQKRMPFFAMDIPSASEMFATLGGHFNSVAERHSSHRFPPLPRLHLCHFPAVTPGKTVGPKTGVLFSTQSLGKFPRCASLVQ